MKLDVSIYYLLKKHKLIDNTIKKMIHHMNIETLTVRRMKLLCGIKEELLEKELAQRIALLISSCDQTSENYNEKLYIELSRAGYNAVRVYETDKKHFSEEYVESLIDNMKDVVFETYNSSSRRR